MIECGQEQDSCQSSTLQVYEGSTACRDPALLCMSWRVFCLGDLSLKSSRWHRSAPAVALRKGKSNWLFDCGEDTQRQLLKQALVRPGKIDRVFVTRASGDAAFGLPGMQTVLLGRPYHNWTYSRVKKLVHKL